MFVSKVLSHWSLWVCVRNGCLEVIWRWEIGGEGCLLGEFGDAVDHVLVGGVVDEDVDGAQF